MTRPGQVLGIDALRFLAACAVVSLHLWGSQIGDNPTFTKYLLSTVFNRGDIAMPAYAPPIAFVGAIGVQVFFSISGFVIAYSASRSPSVMTFAFHRLMRLLPALWICTIVSALIALLSQYYTPIETLRRTILSALLFPVGGKIDDVVWTLILELVFYTYVALINPMKRPRRLVALGIFLSVASLLYWTFMKTFECEGPDAVGDVCSVVNNAYIAKICRISLLQHGAFFALGIFFWRLMEKSKGHIAAIIGLVVALIPCAMQVASTSEYYWRNFGAMGASQTTWIMLAVWLAFIAVMAISVFFVTPINRLLSPLASQVRRIGLATYPLYLLHNFVGGSVLAFALVFGLPLLPAFILAATMATIVAIFVATKLEPAFRSQLSSIALATQHHILAVLRSKIQSSK